MNFFGFFTFFVIHATFVSANERNEYTSFIGENVELKCQGAFLRWFFHNKTEIRDSPKFKIDENAKETKLIIKKFEDTDSGIYACANKTNDVSSFDLKPFFPLTITQNYKSIVVNTDSEVTFDCIPKGSPRPSKYYWWFGDNRLWHGGKIEITDSSLTLKNLRPSQSGEYACVVEQNFRSYRNIQEKNFRLVVADTNSSFSPPTEHKYKHNNTVKLDCTVTSIPNANISWWRKYEHLGKNESLIFENVQPKDSGLYTCSDDEDKLQHFLLTVEYPPILKKTKTGPIVVETDIGKTASLQCAANGLPSCRFSWFKNDKTEVFENIETFYNSSTLKVKITTKDDYGNYTCKVTNELGEKQLVFSVVP